MTTGMPPDRNGPDDIFSTGVLVERLIESLPLPTMAVSDGKILAANPDFVRLTGFDSFREIQGRPLDEILCCPDTDLIVGAGPAHSVAGEITRKDRRALHVDMQVVPLNASARTVLFVMRETASQKLFQDRLVQIEKMVMLGMLAAGIAHEIRNPLAYVMTNLDFVCEELSQFSSGYALPMEEKDLAKLGSYQNMLDKARRGLEQVNGIVSNLKVFSRMQETEMCPVDVNRSLEFALQIASAEVRRKALLVRRLREVPMVLASDTRLTQVFLNLIMNAAHAIPDGSASQNRIEVATRSSPSGHVVIEILDTGCGIPPGNLAKIFEPFYTTKKSGVGTGLGLSLCREIVGNLGGEIQVESTEGVGSVFKIVLPTVKRAEDHASKPKILIVDDDSILAESLEYALSDRFRVSAVTSGKKALEMIQESADWECVLCDLSMDELSGMDVFQQLARSNPGFEQKMVFMTGGAFTDEMAEFLAQVENRRLEKPFNLGTVRQVLFEEIQRTKTL